MFLSTFHQLPAAVNYTYYYKLRLTVIYLYYSLKMYNIID